jgi:hypothetical protein
MKHVLLAGALSAIVLPTPIPTPVAAPQYFGIYPASVMSDVDPLQTGRLLVDVPSAGVTGLWAQASAPYANGALPAVPPLGSSVWVEFQQGNPDYPVWVGWRPAP